MAEPMKSRFAIDLDDLERQLRETASTQPKAAPADPLAELARIVGQDDPFKAIFKDNPAPRPASSPEQAPSQMPARARPVAAPQVAVQREATPAAEPPHSGQGTRVDPSIDDLLRDFDLAMARSDAGVQGASARSEATASVRSAPGVAAPSASANPAALADPMVDAFDALLRDELNRGEDPAQARGAVRPSPRLDLDPADLDAGDARARDLDRSSGRGDLDPPGRDLDEEPPPADYPEPPVEPVEDLRSLEPKQPRKGLMIAAGLMGVAALGIGAVVGLGGLFGGGPGATSGGEVPVVRAESGPSKVQPANPGGVDIPNQNKQIFERAGESKPADTRVVNREEQPMDVQAAARQAARVVLPAPGSDQAGAPAPAPQPPAGMPIAPGIAAAPQPQPNGQGTAPTASQTQPQATIQPAQPPALGEPRRVRTVSVRPDGTIAPAPGAPEAGHGAPAAPAAAPPAPPPRAAQPSGGAGGAPVVRPPQPPAPTRQQVAAAPATQPVPPAATPPRAPESAAPRSGGVMVQLAAPGSEAEARAIFNTLQRRHSAQLAGETPIIRRAESNGRTVYRLRIGPYATREEAASKCEAIRADGGQCFLATN